MYKEIELYKVFTGIANYYKIKGLRRFLFLERRKYNIKKEIKKEKLFIEEYLKKESFREVILEKLYFILKPIDDLIWSMNKKKYKK